MPSATAARPTRTAPPILRPQGWSSRRTAHLDSLASADPQSRTPNPKPKIAFSTPFVPTCLRAFLPQPPSERGARVPVFKGKGPPRPAGRRDASNCPGLFRLVPAFFGLANRRMSEIEAGSATSDAEVFRIFPDISGFFHFVTRSKPAPRATPTRSGGCVRCGKKPAPDGPHRIQMSLEFTDRRPSGLRRGLGESVCDGRGLGVTWRRHR